MLLGALETSLAFNIKEMHAFICCYFHPLYSPLQLLHCEIKEGESTAAES